MYHNNRKARCFNLKSRRKSKKKDKLERSTGVCKKNFKNDKLTPVRFFTLEICPVWPCRGRRRSGVGRAAVTGRRRLGLVDSSDVSFHRLECGLVGFAFNASLDSLEPITKGSKEGPPCGRHSCSQRVLDWARQVQPRDRMCGLTQAYH